MIKETETGREGDKPLVESRDPNEEQHPGVSVGLIRVQEILLGPGAVGGAQFHLSTGVPRTALVILKGTGTSAPPLHRVSAQLLLDSPGMLCSAPDSTQSCGVSTEPGSAQSRVALHPSSCLMHPSEGQDKPRKGTLDEGAHVAAETGPLKPAKTQNSCTSNTSPLATDLSQTQGKEGKEGSTQEMLPKCWQMLPVLR